jgi:hypothetical protein
MGSCCGGDWRIAVEESKVILEYSRNWENWRSLDTVLHAVVGVGKGLAWIASR